MISLLESDTLVVLVTAFTVGLVVVFHYEVIRLLNLWLPRRRTQLQDKLHGRHTILLSMFVLLFAHVIEIWLFGAAFWWLLAQQGYGSIEGYAAVNFLDCVYFSAANYTTVGWGDLAASGDIRFLAGTEALVGFMMITWSASFSYLVMARTWGDDED